MTFLQATLLVSFLMHAVGLFGWSLAPPVNAGPATSSGSNFIVTVVDYQEPAAIVAAAPAPAQPSAPAPGSGPRVQYANQTGYVGTLEPPKPHAPTPREQPHNRPTPAVINVAAPPPPNPQQNRAPEPTTSAAASSDPPKPNPTPSPLATPLATPTPVPSPLATPVASPKPNGRVLVQDPRADFSLHLQYHNDPRLRKAGSATQEVDLAQVSQLPDVKPVLARVPRQVLPLNDAGRYGLKAMNMVRATVKVAVDTKKDSIAPLVPPSKIQVSDITIDGKPVEGATRDQLLLFIQDGVSATQWLPGSSKGVWADHSEQVFEVEIVQVSDDTAMSPPTSRAP